MEKKSCLRKTNYFSAPSVAKLRYKTNNCNGTNMQNGVTSPECFTS